MRDRDKLENPYKKDKTSHQEFVGWIVDNCPLDHVLPQEPALFVYYIPNLKDVK
jgi:hypothetical protein